LKRQYDGAEEARDRGRQPQIPLPQAAEARTPDAPPVTLWGNARELHERVVHVKHFVAQYLFENRVRRHILLQHIAIDREPLGGGLLRNMEESQQSVIGLFFNVQVIGAVSAGRKPIRLETRLRAAGKLSQELRSPQSEHFTMTMFVDRMNQIEASQERVRGLLRRSDQIPSAIGFGFAETKQFMRAPLGVAPDPAMDSPQHRSAEYHFCFFGVFTILSQFCQFDRSERLPTRVFAEIVTVLIGIALLACAIGADHAWLDRHFLPSFFVSRRTYVLAASSGRIVEAALGVALALIARPRIGRFVARVPPRTLFADTARVSLAVALALGTSELVLRRTYSRATEEPPAAEEPLRRRDPQLGWSFMPSHTGRDKEGGREIEYAFDPAGYRVRRADEPVDPDRPTILFTGESVMVGLGLTWDESIPAQVAALLETQSANIAVHGFAGDQAYLRLKNELPRFRQPVAVVSLFMPTLFDRNLDDDRPHLGPGLVWLPAEPRWRLMAVAKQAVPYRSEQTIERGIAVTREVLLATVDLARAGGAVPLILVPQFAPEDSVERKLRRRILDDGGLPYVLVELDPSWRVPGDRHPDARAAHAMAAAIASRLRGR
jgi:hypothetical protein